MWKHLCFAVVSMALGCATHSTSSRTWTATPSSDVGLTGRVESVREVVNRVEGQPAAGAAAGALIGGALFHGRGPSTLFGAAAGAMTGAAVSSGSAERRAYEVRVRFQDGSDGIFDYQGYSPFAPGDRVVVVEGGLARA